MMDFYKNKFTISVKSSLGLRRNKWQIIGVGGRPAGEFPLIWYIAFTRVDGKYLSLLSRLTMKAPCSVSESFHIYETAY
jgi:hypothetical protein